ncbi:50S ribosome-binding GTPase [bacterium]|nr:50S ribosome-binding GTPase [bacterium]MBU1983829.1 50S ribosome-binding GTPase [bacterium]
MNTQKFVAPTMKEAIARIKEELGEDALIIRSERVKVGGSLNRFRSEMIEVTAASAEEMKGEAQAGPEFAQTLERSLSRSSMPEPSPIADPRLGQISDEVRQLREDLSDLGRLLKYSQIEKMPRELVRLWKKMGESGVNGEWATDLAQEALLRLRPDELVSAVAVESHLIQKISGVVRQSSQPPPKLNRSYKIVAVGSPGAGKTTLVQKLASDPAAYGKRKVGLISLDTHRMAAIEQLKAFARIAGVPLEIVFQPAQLSDAAKRLSGSEVILVDTPGCTAADHGKLDLLDGFLRQLDCDEVHLVLNSSMRDEEMNYAGHRFRDVGITHLSFTHIDETLRQGYLLNVARVAERPIAWISRGQGFVGCIERFTPEHLRRWMTLDQAESKAESARETLSSVPVK